MAKSDLQHLLDLYERFQLEDVRLRDPVEYSPKVAHEVFVYGTLKRGFRNHGRLAGAKFLGSFTTEERYQLLSKRVESGLAPVMLPDGPYQVRGELYLISGSVLKTLDLCEGHPFVYRRDQIYINGFDKPVNAYVYGLGPSEAAYTDGIRVNQRIAEFIQGENHG